METFTVVLVLPLKLWGLPFHFSRKNQVDDKAASNVHGSTEKQPYLRDLEKEREGLWFLSRDRDLSLLLSLERDLGKRNAFNTSVSLHGHTHSAMPSKLV